MLLEVVPGNRDFFSTSTLWSQPRNEPKLSSSQIEAYICMCVCLTFPSAYQNFNENWQNEQIPDLNNDWNAFSALFVNILDEMYWKSMKISRWCGSLPYFHMLWVHPWELAAPFSKLSCHMELICYSNHRQIFNISDIMTFSIFLLNMFSNFCH